MNQFVTQYTTPGFNDYTTIEISNSSIRGECNYFIESIMQLKCIKSVTSSLAF